ncbi:MAG TPA: lipid-A-disaccharide synthase [bacterium]
MNNKVMIIAGEASGDLHGSGLVRELLKLQPDLELFGVGGDKMQQHGVSLRYHINEMSVLGFVDVLKRFRFFKRVYHDLVALMKEKQPRLLILIDYPGLNLKLARAAKRQGIQVLYYIAPQVWAWGSNRIPKMVRLVDKMAVIIPFEAKLFRNAGIDAKFVGHPLLEGVASRHSKDEFIRLNNLALDKKIIGLLPGSRVQEIKRLLPEMIVTAKRFRKKHPEFQVVIGRASSVPDELYRDLIGKNNNILLLENSTYEVMQHSDLLIVASGTATLESALFETPLMIVYKVDPISYFIGKQLIRIESIGLVNVIAERKIVPEFIQDKFRWNYLLPEMEELLFNDEKRNRVIHDLKQIKQKLGEPGASQRAAEIAMSMINSPLERP